MLSSYIRNIGDQEIPRGRHICQYNKTLMPGSSSKIVAIKQPWLDNSSVSQAVRASYWSSSRDPTSFTLIVMMALNRD